MDRSYEINEIKKKGEERNPWMHECVMHAKERESAVLCFD
jgi:hypothetical protein